MDGGYRLAGLEPWNLVNFETLAVDVPQNFESAYSDVFMARPSTSQIVERRTTNVDHRKQ